MRKPELRLLVPNSGIQFITRTFASPSTMRERLYVEQPKEDGLEGGPDERVRLIPEFDPRNPDKRIDVPAKPGSRPYSGQPDLALRTFIDTWVPVPYLVHSQHPFGSSHEPKFYAGPTNWARVHVSQVPPSSRAEKPQYRAVFAFDTSLEPAKAVDPAKSAKPEAVPDERRRSENFTTPRAEQIGHHWEYSLVSRVDLLADFIHKKTSTDGQTHNWGSWVREWVERRLRSFYRRATRGERDHNESDGQFEALVRYLTFLEVLQTAVAPPKLQFIQEDEKTTRPVDVELVLDVGNSRTHGMLIERFPNEATIDLATSYTLSIRDLQKPHMVYEGSFASDVELFEARFGDDDLSQRAGGRRAFFWPSAVRVGPEVANIRQEQQGTELYSGLSSPKRYLWDVSPRVQEWRFPENQYVRDMPPLIGRALRNRVNASGDVLGSIAKERRQYQRISGRVNERRADAMTYSRSSFYSLMIAEIVWQALVQINCPDRREKRQQNVLPRRLTRLILTLPSATPVREQLLMKLRAEGAIELLWDQMDWIKKGLNGQTDLVPRPEVKVTWDEASCVQTVWLYGEISRKFGGRMNAFFDLVGRPREQMDETTGRAVLERSLRVASVDVGGGTTDLMITTYHVEMGKALKPRQDFREGSRVAGDDILKAVIERLVVPAIENTLEQKGHPDPSHLLRNLFGAERQQMSEQERHVRRQFVNRVLRPIGLGLLADYENMTDNAEAMVQMRSLSSFFSIEDAEDDAKLGIPVPILDYLRTPVRAAGISDFKVIDVKVPVDFQMIAGAASTVLAHVFDNIAEALHHFDPDVVLLSGRPSKLPVIPEMLLDRLAVAPDRLVLMHQYSPGAWYPQSETNRGGRIGDPKTTAAVGGMLCALSARELTNFMLFTDKLQMRSTANFIGELGTDMHLPDDRIIFDISDLVSEDPDARRKEHPFITKTRLGFRQLPLDRWMASPLYQLRMIANNSYRVSLPITLVIERELSRYDADAERPETVLDAEAKKEELKLSYAGGLDTSVEPGRPPRTAAIVMEFRTMADEEGYWLDTGILTFP